MLNRLFPKQVDNRFEGHRVALWLLGLLIAVKLAMSINMIFNAAEVAVGADKIPLEDYGPEAAQQVLTLFRLVGLDQLALTVAALASLLRYRALVPAVTLLFLVEHLARRLIVSGSLLPPAISTAFLVNAALIALLALILVLSLRRSPTGSKS